MSENLIPIVTSTGGGFFIGIILGYFLKKVIKILLFVIGGTIAFLLCLQQQQLISLNLNEIEESSTSIFTSILSSLGNASQFGEAMSLALPMAAGLSAGFAIGLMKA